VRPKPQDTSSRIGSNSTHRWWFTAEYPAESVSITRSAAPVGGPPRAAARSKLYSMKGFSDTFTRRTSVYRTARRLPDRRFHRRLCVGPAVQTFQAARPTFHGKPATGPFLARARALCRAKCAIVRRETGRRAGFGSRGGLSTGAVVHWYTPAVRPNVPTEWRGQLISPGLCGWL